MAVNVKQLIQKENLLAPGHAACAGCAAPSVFRQVLLASPVPVVCGSATGCMEVVTTIFPRTAWRTPFIHNAFENSAATISGVEAAYRSLKRKGKIDKEIGFIAFGGDGGTYDIGFQSLSGAMERGHNMLYVCYDNEAYMNTGIQRSGATPKGAQTSTTPVGKVKQGKEQNRKDLTAAIIAHDIPYVAQAAPHNFRDLMNKVEKAMSIDGPAFLNILAPCPRGWRFESKLSIKLTQVAAETCFWPLFEVENGVWKINYKPKEKKPLVEWLKMQGRFKHLMRPENQHVIDELQATVDQKWEALLQREEMSQKKG